MPAPLKLTRKSDGVVVGAMKPVPMMVTSWLSQWASGPVVALCGRAGVRRGWGREMVVSNGANATPSGRKRGETSTALPERRIVAPPDVDAGGSVKEIAPERTMGVFSAAPPLSLRETVG